MKKDKIKDSKLLLLQLKELINDEKDVIAQLANASSLLKMFYHDAINWVGFYRLADNGDLILGPFQGKIACVRLKKGIGVCQKAVIDQKTTIIDDVHQFSGHIACDAESNSEIVIPMIVDDNVVWVLDIDSPNYAQFDHIDSEFLTEFCQILKDIL
ncbi:MAG: GAF domain-containing protein [Erysipelotrichaceae bacterium]|nr:GAF domain-containing protein [Erysipelotrichaceae bacterium]MDD4643083.1 GAF domain-containing protein [Erysipelotrichaceae bacterium]